MKYLPLVWRNLKRRKTRTIFTVLSIVVAFVLFGILAALNVAFSQGVELAGNDRLIIHAQGLDHPAAARELRGAAGDDAGRGRRAAPDVVRRASTRSPSNFFMQMPGPTRTGC